MRIANNARQHLHTLAPKAAPLTAAACILGALITWSGDATAQPEPPSPEDQQAEEEDPMTSSTRPMWAALGLGPSLGLTACGSGGCSSRGSFTQFMLTQEFGYHFSGDGEGPAIGVSVDEAFGDNIVRIQPGVKFWWDIPVTDMALYITPSAKVGYGLLTNGGTKHAFNFQLGAALRMVFLDRVLVYAQPATLTGLANGDGVALTYDILVGGGVTF